MNSIPLDLKIMAADGKTVELKTDTGHRFRWPANLMPQPCDPGDLVRFDPRTISTEGLSSDDRASAARAMINELLGTE